MGQSTETSGFYQGLLLDEVDGSWQDGVAPDLPANAKVAQDETQLASVSCTSVGNCTAVGTYLDSSSRTEGLLLTQTGGVWATGVEAPLPANADPNNPDVVLRSVSCASEGNCTAVGTYGDSSDRYVGVLLSESAGVWATGVEAVLPADADPDFPNVSLDAVSCSSPGNCTAVGIYNLVEGIHMSTTAKGLMLTETDGSWGTGVEPVLPPSASPDYVWLNAVSCASAGNCSALGAYSDNAGHQGLLLTEKSGAWKTGVKASLPAGANHQNYVLLSSISCPSAGNCEAVGGYDPEGTVLLAQTAGVWRKGVKATTSGVPGVPVISCPSVGDCGAVSGDTLLTEVGGNWSTGAAATLPVGATGVATLASVSCGAIGHCSAVGRYTDTAGAQQGVLLNSTPICLVPRLRGKTLASARRSIKSHGCSVGKVKHAASRRGKGRVISQKPKPGTQLAHHARVSLVVSKGSRT